MKLLLDTHLLLWWLADSPRLTPKVRALIGDPDNTIFISAVTLWEIRLKQSLAKLRLPPRFEELLKEEAFENLPLSAEHAREVARLPWHHRDPFDRMLLAQARVSGLRFLTGDRLMERYGEPVLHLR